MEETKEMQQDLLLIYRLEQKMDYKNPAHIKKVAESLREKNPFKSVVGRKYYREVASLAQGKFFSNQCVACGQIRDSQGMLCSTCVAKIEGAQGIKIAGRKTDGAIASVKTPLKEAEEKVTKKDIIIVKVIPITIMVIYLLWQLFLWWLSTFGMGVYYTTEYYGSEFNITSGHGSVNYESLMFFVKLCGSYILYNMYEGLLFRTKTKKVEAYLAAKHPWYGARISGKFHAVVVTLLIAVVIGVLVSQFVIQAPAEEEMIQFFNGMS